MNHDDRYRNGISLTPARSRYPRSLLATDFRPRPQFNVSYDTAPLPPRLNTPEALFQSPSLLTTTSRRTSTTRGDRRNAFTELSAPQFDSFVNDITKRIRDALAGPTLQQIQQQNESRAEETEEKEEEEGEHESEDVFGQVIQLDHSDLHPSVPPSYPSPPVDRPSLFRPDSSAEPDEPVVSTMSVDDDHEDLTALLRESETFGEDEEGYSDKDDDDAEEVDEYFDDDPYALMSDAITEMSEVDTHRPVMIQSAATLYRAQLLLEEDDEDESSSDDDGDLSMDQLFSRRPLPILSTSAAPSALKITSTVIESVDGEEVERRSMGVESPRMSRERMVREGEQREDESEARTDRPESSAFEFDTPESLDLASDHHRRTVSPQLHTTDQYEEDRQMEEEWYGQDGSSPRGDEVAEWVDGEMTYSNDSRLTEIEQDDSEGLPPRIPSHLKGKGKALIDDVENSPQSQSRPLARHQHSDNSSDEEDGDDTSSRSDTSSFASITSVDLAGASSMELYKIHEFTSEYLETVREKDGPLDLIEKVERRLATIEEAFLKLSEDGSQAGSVDASMQVDQEEGEGEEEGDGQWSQNPIVAARGDRVEEVHLAAEVSALEQSINLQLEDIAEVMVGQFRTGAGGPIEFQATTTTTTTRAATFLPSPDLSDAGREQEPESTSRDVSEEPHTFLDPLPVVKTSPIRQPKTSPARNTYVMSSDYIAAGDMEEGTEGEVESADEDERVEPVERLKGLKSSLAFRKVAPPPPSQHISSFFDRSTSVEYGEEEEDEELSFNDEDENGSEKIEVRREVECIILGSSDEEDQEEEVPEDEEASLDNFGTISQPNSRDASSEPIAYESSVEGSGEMMSPPASPPVVRNVVDPGEWDVTTPIRFGGASLDDAIKMATAREAENDDLPAGYDSLSVAPPTSYEEIAAALTEQSGSALYDTTDHHDFLSQVFNTPTGTFRADVPIASTIDLMKYAIPAYVQPELSPVLAPEPIAADELSTIQLLYDDLVPVEAYADDIASDGGARETEEYLELAEEEGQGDIEDALEYSNEIAEFESASRVDELIEIMSDSDVEEEEEHEEHEEELGAGEVLEDVQEVEVREEGEAPTKDVVEPEVVSAESLIRSLVEVGGGEDAETVEERSTEVQDQASIPPSASPSPASPQLSNTTALSTSAPHSLVPYLVESEPMSTATTSSEESVDELLLQPVPRSPSAPSALPAAVPLEEASELATLTPPDLPAPNTPRRSTRGTSLHPPPPPPPPAAVISPAPAPSTPSHETRSSTRLPVPVAIQVATTPAKSKKRDRDIAEAEEADEGVHLLEAELPQKKKKKGKKQSQQKNKNKKAEAAESQASSPPPLPTVTTPVVVPVPDMVDPKAEEVKEGGGIGTRSATMSANRKRSREGEEKEIETEVAVVSIPAGVKEKKKKKPTKGRGSIIKL